MGASIMSSLSTFPYSCGVGYSMGFKGKKRMMRNLSGLQSERG